MIPHLLELLRWHPGPLFVVSVPSSLWPAFRAKQDARRGQYAAFPTPLGGLHVLCDSRVDDSPCSLATRTAPLLLETFAEMYGTDGLVLSDGWAANIRRAADLLGVRPQRYGPG
jgi:hypothetical protein